MTALPGQAGLCALHPPDCQLVDPGSAFLAVSFPQLCNAALGFGSSVCDLLVIKSQDYRCAPLLSSGVSCNTAAKMPWCPILKGD